MNKAKAAQLNGRIAFRSLTGVTGKTIKVSIPPEMVWALEWTGDEPIRIEMQDDGSLRLTQVKAKEYDLTITNTGWKRRPSIKSRRHRSTTR